MSGDSDKGLRGVLRGIIGLSSGTIVARVLSALGQILLAFWLSPSEFGYWAAASSILAFLTGIINFGEVNGYLSGRGSGYSTARHNARLLNWVLVIGGLGIAFAYAAADRWQVAVLAAIISVSIPFMGEADLLYAASVKQGSYKRAVAGQMWAAIAKIAIGIGIAILTQSAIAIAISTLCFSLVMNAALFSTGKKAAAHEPRDSEAVPKRERFSWAVNSWTMTLPLQAGFVVAQFVASPALLGLYFLSYQVTLAVSGVLSGPVAKISLATLGGRSSSERAKLAFDLCSLLGAGMLVLASLAALVAPLLAPVIDEKWLAVLPATVILLASLPARIMTPVVDALQQSNNRWWRSTTLNLVDAVGTGLSALTLLTGDLLVLAVTLTIWKTVFCVARLWASLGGTRYAARAALAAPVFAGASLVVAGALLEGAVTWWLFGTALVLGLAWIASHRALRGKGGTALGDAVQQ